MSRNPRITAKERGLLKSALRRVFARSDLRREVLETVKVVTHFDARHPRVKHWSKCGGCKTIKPRYLFVVDHISPVIPIDRTFEEMTLDEVADRLWCAKSNLNPICKECHKVKTSAERKQRKIAKMVT